MRGSVIRTAVVASVVTAIVVTAGALWAVPRFLNPQPALADSVMQPALYTGSAPAVSDDTQQPVLTTRPQARRVTRTYSSSQPVSYGEPVVRHHRSTEKSVLIVAGSAGTGAAIGALAGGGKGAGIGAIAGGVGGLIYDRLTANK